MKKEEQFNHLLKPIKTKIFIEIVMKELFILFALSGGVVLLITLITSLFIIPFVSFFITIGISVTILIFIVRICINYPKTKQLVAIYNQYVEEDYAITAYQILKKDGLMEEIILRKALQEMKKKQAAVRKRRIQFFYPKLLTIALVSFMFITLLFLFPTATLELSKQKETELKVIKKTEKELEEKIKNESNKNVQKKLDNLAQIIKKQDTVKKALDEVDKQQKEADLKKRKESEKQNALENKRKLIQNSGLSSLAEAIEKKDVSLIKKEWQDANKQYQALKEEQKTALNQLSGLNGELTEEQLATLVKEIEKSLDAEEGVQEIAQEQKQLSQLKDYMQKESAASNLTISSSNSVASNQTNSENATNGNQSTKTDNQSQNNSSNQSNSNRNTNNGNGTGSGSGNGNGTGSGSGNGNGSGNNNGNGLGSGGSGSGSGGEGAGFGSGTKEFLSIPNSVDGKENKEVDTGALGEGQQGEITEGNGPVLNGSTKSYQQIYSEYEKAYRESTTRYNLPQDLQGIVKDYFSDISPEEK